MDYNYTEQQYDEENNPITEPPDGSTPVIGIATVNTKKVYTDCVDDADLSTPTNVKIMNGVTLTISFEASLTEAQKTTLDGFVTTALGFQYPPPEYKPSRQEILNAIFADFGSTEQKDRIIGALNKYPTFAFALDDYGYTLARETMQGALTATDITQADFDMINSKLPAE